MMNVVGCYSDSEDLDVIYEENDIDTFILLSQQRDYLTEIHEYENLVDYLKFKSSPYNSTAITQYVPVGIDVNMQCRIDNLENLQVELLDGYYMDMTREIAITYLENKIKTLESILLHTS